MLPRIVACLLLACAPLACRNVPDEELTLDNCVTNVAADAPAFFRRYFRCVTVTTSGSSVVVESTGLPPHRSPYYGEGHPNYEPFDTSRGSEYRPNPNLIADDPSFTVELPLEPVSRNLTMDASLVDGRLRTSTSEYDLGAAGVALDGVMLFNSLAGPGDDIEDEKYTFDSYNAHPEPEGGYHYHTATKGPLEVLRKAGLVTNAVPGEAQVEVYGILCDGTVVLGCTELDGSAPDADGLDAQAGHVHDLVDEEGTTHFTARYHTHVCPQRFGYGFTPEIQYYSTCVVR